TVPGRRRGADQHPAQAGDPGLDRTGGGGRLAGRAAGARGTAGDRQGPGRLWRPGGRGGAAAWRQPFHPVPPHRPAGTWRGRGRRRLKRLPRGSPPGRLWRMRALRWLLGSMLLALLAYLVAGAVAPRAFLAAW